MKLHFLFFALGLLTLRLHGQAAGAGVTNNTFVIEVQLADDITKTKLPPDCGIFEMNSMTFTYKVIRVIQGNYKAETILINHRCPKQLIDQKQMENEKIYTLKLRVKTSLSESKKDTDKIEYEVIE